MEITGKKEKTEKTPYYQALESSKNQASWQICVSCTIDLYITDLNNNW